MIQIPTKKFLKSMYELHISIQAPFELMHQSRTKHHNFKPTITEFHRKPKTVRDYLLRLKKKESELSLLADEHRNFSSLKTSTSDKPQN